MYCSYKGFFGFAPCGHDAEEIRAAFEELFHDY
jgi:hypothetical protein